MGIRHFLWRSREDCAREAVSYDDAPRKAATGPLPQINPRAPAGNSRSVRVALVAMVATLTWIDARDIYAGRQDELRTVIEVASKAVQQEYDEFKKGTISEAEAQQRAKASIRAMRYNTNDYFFVQDKDIITHCSRRAAGSGRHRHVEETGSDRKYFSVEMNKIAAKNGQGYVDYQYAKPGAALDQPSPKLSYVKLFAPWQWTIGTGMYIDESKRRFGRESLDGRDRAGVPDRHRRLRGRRHFRLSNRLEQLERGDDVAGVGRKQCRAARRREARDEVGEMARAVQVFKEQRGRTRALEAEALANRSQAEVERERHGGTGEGRRGAGGGRAPLGEGLRTSPRRPDGAPRRRLHDDLRADSGRFQRGDRQAEDDHAAVVDSADAIQSGTQGNIGGLRRPVAAAPNSRRRAWRRPRRRSTRSPRR